MPALADFRFFNFIIPNMENQIRMPPTFSNLVRENMSNRVEISTTNGQSWSISWVVEEEHPHQIVFTGGWRAFYEHYHLRIGAMLLLSYHQPKFFYVALHGTSFCEINYGKNLRNGSLPAIPAHGNYTVQFFAIMLVNNPDTLMLPPRFSRDYGQSLPRPLTLTTPTGQRHRVGWNMELNGRIVLHGGWDAVWEHYGLRDEWLVLFHYHDIQNTMYVMFFNCHTIKINYLAHAGPRTDCTFISYPTAPRSMHIADGFRSTNPFFVKPIVHRLASRFLPNVLPLPGVYEDSPISITNERGAWTVQYTHYVGRTNGCFGVGWSTLATACQLRHGHVCVFERLVPQDYQLHIY
ncbi:hypothetical protein Ahy_B02g059998 [Arachis hypogaea]|uniref:TF-B3 domain-containing protein n=1 Tax=Arachis hypogaea TaxID=3818 RepID=A0A445AHN6_ARAHY|nr:hypothetical protein Ahy_B02g059998 [Arachis hypogaea]